MIICEEQNIRWALSLTINTISIFPIFHEKEKTCLWPSNLALSTTSLSPTRSPNNLAISIMPLSLLSDDPTKCITPRGSDLTPFDPPRLNFVLERTRWECQSISNMPINIYPPYTGPSFTAWAIHVSIDDVDILCEPLEGEMSEYSLIVL